MQIYIDREQCEKFQAKYFAEDTITVSAEALLNSKGGDGYDQEHRDVLEPFGAQQISASREQGDPPGWYNIHTEAMEQLSITVTQRSDDWHACVTGDDARWEGGRSRAEAIGKMFLNPQNADLQKAVKIVG